MRYARHAARLYNQPLLITETKAQVIESVFRAHVEGRAAEVESAVEHPEPEAFASGVSITRAKGGYLLADNGVGIVQVFGALVQRGDNLDAMSGLMGYNRIGAQLAAAMDDSAVNGILMEFDSPGGEVSGCFDLAAKIRGYAQSKPIWAFANEQAFSAAYALASAADQLYLPETGMVGSVGVIMLHVDQSQLDAKLGLKYTPIFAGKKKNDFSSHEPLSDRAKAEGKAEVDRYYDIFVNAVAGARGISSDAVRATEAGLLNPEQALAVGFADGVATFSETLAAFADVASGKTQVQSKRAAGATTPGESNMTTQSTNAPAAAQNNAATEAAASADQLAKTRADALSEGTKAGGSGERARIKAITQCEEAAGRGKLAEHIAYDTDLSPDQAKAMLAAAPKEAAAAPVNRLEAAMQAVPNPNVGADAARSGSEDDAEGQTMLARVVDLRNKAVRSAK